MGEDNPFGEDPRFALYPYPERASGGRLARILGLEPREYLRLFDRANLCRGRWAIREAREGAAQIFWRNAGHDRAIVLLGRKVVAAFSACDLDRILLRPFAFVRIPGGPTYASLPHPSGRNTIWNDPSTRESARSLLREVRALPA